MSSRGQLKTRGPLKLREIDSIFQEVSHTPGQKKVTIHFENGNEKGQLAINLYKNFDRQKYNIELLFFQRVNTQVTIVTMAIQEKQEESNYALEDIVDKLPIQERIRIFIQVLNFVRNLHKVNRRVELNQLLELVQIRKKNKYFHLHFPQILLNEEESSTNPQNADKLSIEELQVLEELCDLLFKRIRHQCGNMFPIANYKQYLQSFKKRNITQEDQLPKISKLSEYLRLVVLEKDRLVHWYKLSQDMNCFEVNIFEKKEGFNEKIVLRDLALEKVDQFKRRLENNCRRIMQSKKPQLSRLSIGEKKIALSTVFFELAEKSGREYPEITESSVSYWRNEGKMKITLDFIPVQREGIPHTEMSNQTSSENIYEEIKQLYQKKQEMCKAGVIQINKVQNMVNMFRKISVLFKQFVWREQLNINYPVIKELLYLFSNWEIWIKQDKQDTLLKETIKFRKIWRQSIFGRKFNLEWDHDISGYFCSSSEQLFQIMRERFYIWQSSFDIFYRLFYIIAFGKEPKINYGYFYSYVKHEMHKHNFEMKYQKDEHMEDIYYKLCGSYFKRRMCKLDLKSFIVMDYQQKQIKMRIEERNQLRHLISVENFMGDKQTQLVNVMKIMHDTFEEMKQLQLNIKQEDNIFFFMPFEECAMIDISVQEQPSKNIVLIFNCETIYSLYQRLLRMKIENKLSRVEEKFPVKLIFSLFERYQDMDEKNWIKMMKKIDWLIWLKSFYHLLIKYQPRDPDQYILHELLSKLQNLAMVHQWQNISKQTLDKISLKTFRDFLRYLNELINEAQASKKKMEYDTTQKIECDDEGSSSSSSNNSKKSRCSI